MTCSSCDDYRFVPGPDGVNVRCPDCLKDAVRCPVHGTAVVRVKGVTVEPCCGCITESDLATALIERASAARDALGAVA